MEPQGKLLACWSVQRNAILLGSTFVAPQRNCCAIIRFVDQPCNAVMLSEAIWMEIKRINC